MTNAATPCPPLRFEWLADHRRRPVALRLHLPTGSHAPCSATWLDNPALHALAAAWPCVVDTAVWDALGSDAAAAEKAGLQRLTPERCVDAPVQFPATPAADQWVSGLWFTQPPLRLAAAQAASRARALQLVQLVTADADTHDIEAVLRQDASLSYQLLRVVNSVAMGGQREITSFAQAILLLGRQQLRRWLHLMLFAARDDDPRSAMLGAQVTLRARSMELLAEACGEDRAQQELAFITGMFSLLGTLFGQPLAQVLQPLPLPAGVREALLHHQGPIGEWLLTVCASEAPVAPPSPAPDGPLHHTTPGDLAQHLAALPLSTDAFNTLRCEAALWALQMTREADA